MKLNTRLLRPGMRLAVGLSGGADSVALLRALVARRGELGLALHAAHLHHGLRGAEADEDLAFCRELTTQLGVPLHEEYVDVNVAASADPATEKESETIEEAARRVRYAWFRRLMAEVPLDAIATAHTLDDQAETVLGKFLRGAWTEGLSGIYPEIVWEEGKIIRPTLATTRTEIEAYLHGLGQVWREDSSNRHLTFTRNRIRHELLPELEKWNPRLREHLAQMAVLARDEETWWKSEVGRMAPQLLLEGLPVRGGGRSAGTGQTLAIDVTRLRTLVPALQRRLLRHGAEQLGAVPDFEATEALRALALEGRAGQKLELAQRLHAERTARELRLTSGTEAESVRMRQQAPEYRGTIPGRIEGPEFDLSLEIDGVDRGSTAVLRNWRPGDRVTLRYSSGPRKVKEVLERMKVTGSERSRWPVLEWNGRIVWMRGVEVEPDAGIHVRLADRRTGAIAGISPGD